MASKLKRDIIARRKAKLTGNQLMLKVINALSTHQFVSPYNEYDEYLLITITRSNKTGQEMTKRQN